MVEKNYESFYHNFAINIKLILAAVVEKERNFKTVIKALAENEKVDIESKNEIGFMNAKDVFMIALNCEDCNKIKDNINIIMKVIKKEERTFNNILSALNDLVEKNENDCKKFLNPQDISEIILLSEDIDKENEN